MVTEKDIWKYLEDVYDPEIPTVSLVDLGVIKKIDILDQLVRVTLTPTFVGCPATEQMAFDIEAKLAQQGVDNCEVQISFEKPWSSDHITSRGKKALKDFGIAPPPGKGQLIHDIDILEEAECPNCGSERTQMKSPFGPTLCRAIYQCHDCKETFEQFKPL